MRPLSLPERQQARDLAAMCDEISGHVRAHQLPPWLMVVIAKPLLMCLHVVRDSLAQQERLRRAQEHDCTRDRCVR